MTGHLGFSYVGLVYILMLFIPNIIWSKSQATVNEKTYENKVLLWLERVGQAGCTGSVLIFSDFNITEFSAWSLWLIASFLLMIFYELLLVNTQRKKFIVVSLEFPYRLRVCLSWLFCYWAFTEKLFG